MAREELLLVEDAAPTKGIGECVGWGPVMLRGAKNGISLVRKLWAARTRRGE